LKLRKEYLKQSEVIDGTMLNMQTMCFSLEAALSNAGTISVLENANKHIGRIYDGISVDKMEDIRDEMEENQQRRTEIEEVLSRPLDSQQEGLDEDDLARELDELEAEEMETKMLSLEPPVRTQPTAVREPVVTRTEAPVPAKKTTTEDDELNALWAEMQMP
jgi:charged multivesicular body protein 4